VKKDLVNILACPIDKSYPLQLEIFRSNGPEIESGIFICSKCKRWYPIIREIPELLPDDLRDDYTEFKTKWKTQFERLNIK